MQCKQLLSHSKATRKESCNVELCSFLLTYKVCQMQCSNSPKRSRGSSIPCPEICWLGCLGVGVLVEGHIKKWN